MRRPDLHQLPLLPEAAEPRAEGQRLMTARALLRRFGQPEPPPRLVSAKSLRRLVART